MAHGERAKNKSNKQKEFWSRRYPAINGDTVSSYGKKQTHRKERRDAKQESKENQ